MVVGPSGELLALAARLPEQSGTKAGSPPPQGGRWQISAVFSSPLRAMALNASKLRVGGSAASTQPASEPAGGDRRAPGHRRAWLVSVGSSRYYLLPGLGARRGRRLVVFGGGRASGPCWSARLPWPRRCGRSGAPLGLVSCEWWRRSSCSFWPLRRCATRDRRRRAAGAVTQRRAHAPPSAAAPLQIRLDSTHPSPVSNMSWTVTMPAAGRTSQTSGTSL